MFDAAGSIAVGDPDFGLPKKNRCVANLDIASSYPSNDFPPRGISVSARGKDHNNYLRKICPVSCLDLIDTRRWLMSTKFISEMNLLCDGDSPSTVLPGQMKLVPSSDFSDSLSDLLLGRVCCRSRSMMYLRRLLSIVLAGMHLRTTGFGRSSGR